MFENKPDASAPAHEVRYVDRLDPATLDLSSFELGPVYFGNDRILTPPPGQQSRSDAIDLRPEKPLIVQVDAALDPATGVVVWHLQGLDPASGDLQTDPFVGFLDPNQEPPEGQGGVTFSVDPAAGLGTGTRSPTGRRSSST